MKWKRLKYTGRLKKKDPRENGGESVSTEVRPIALAFSLIPNESHPCVLASSPPLSLPHTPIPADYRVLHK